MSVCLLSSPWSSCSLYVGHFYFIFFKRKVGNILIENVYIQEQRGT
jgi:hypothetical protein